MHDVPGVTIMRHRALPKKKAVCEAVWFLPFFMEGLYGEATQPRQLTPDGLAWTCLQLPAIVHT